MTRDMWGIHLANKGWDNDGSEPPLRGQLALVPHAGSVTGLHMQLHHMAEIRRTRPDVFCHWRVYMPNWCQYDPVALAQWMVSAFADWWADPMVGISPANEQNLHYECGEPRQSEQPRFQTAEHYARIGVWNIRVAAEIDRMVPHRRALLIWPALAYGHEPPGAPPDGEYHILESALRMYDVLATHPYGHLDWEDGDKTAPWGEDAFYHSLRDFRPAGHSSHPDDRGGLLTQITDMPCMWTETGTYTHDRRELNATTFQFFAFQNAAAVGRRVIGSTPFIAQSGPEHAPNVIWGNRPLRDALASAPPIGAAQIPVRGEPVPMTLNAKLHAEFGDDYSDLRATLPDNPASKDYPYEHRRLDQVTAYAFHHTDTADGATWESVAQWHATGNEWPGVAYHIGVQGSHVSYLGDVDTSRFCVGPGNTSVICVAVMGNLVAREPTDAELDALRRVVEVLDGHLDEWPALLPHSDFKATSCPGLLAKWLPGLRGEVDEPLRFDKIAWATEEAARILQREGMQAEHDYIVDEYVADAIERRDA